MSDGLYNLSKMLEESKLEFLNSLVDKRTAQVAGNNKTIER